MITLRSTAAFASAACLAGFAVGCGNSGTTPGGGATRSPGASATVAPSAPASRPATPAPVATTPASQSSMSRCHTGQLSTVFTGLNSAMGGARGMTLILTNHSSNTCYVYGYPGLAFFTGRGSPMATHLTWLKAPHSRVVLHPGDNAQAMLTWHVNMDTPTPFSPDIVHITPPDAYTYLWTGWEGGPVRNGDIASWPLSAAPAGPFPTEPGSIANPFNGTCVAVATDGSTVVAWRCRPAVGSQHWTGYSDGTLRLNGKCLDVTGPEVGAKAKLAACTGAATQKWAIGQVSFNEFGPITNTGTGTALAEPGAPRDSITNGTPLVMKPYRGDQTQAPWHVSFRHYMAS